MILDNKEKIAKLNKLQGQRIIIIMDTGARYKGILHKSSDRKIVLSQLCIITKRETSTMSGSNEKRVFLIEKIKNIE